MWTFVAVVCALNVRSPWLAMPLGARLGAKRAGGSLTVASPFLQELGRELPKAVRGQNWSS